MKQTIIVVLGMHRSGTSAITRGLLELGVHLGTQLMPGNAVNPMGFWEDTAIYALNERLLEALGFRWDSVGPMNDAVWQRPEVAELKVEALNLVRERLDASPVWGFKDPRTARLLPFWKSVLEQITTDIRYVIAYRNPISVAKSLTKRNGFAPEKSYLLWLQHLLPAMRDTLGAPRVVVDYDNLVASPEQELRRMGSTLGLRLLDQGDLEANDYVEAFVDGDLRHSVFSSLDLALDPQAAKVVRQANDLLQSLARDEQQLSDPVVVSAVQQISDAMENLGPFAAYLQRQERGLESTQARLAERDSKVAVLEVALAERDSRVAALETAMAERDSKVAALEATVAERDSRVAALETAVAERDSKVAALEVALAERDSKVAALEVALAERDSRVAALETAMAERDSSIKAVAEEAAALRLTVGHLQASVKAYELSTSWRITAPLRALRRTVGRHS